MTTAWAHLMHGELIRALQANIGGVLLAVLAMAAAPWLMISAARGRWLIWRPNGSVVGYVSGVTIAIALVQWGFRLFGN